MNPHVYAQEHPDKPAFIIAETGESLSYTELDQRLNRFSHLLRKLGVQSGEGVAILLENHIRYAEIYWGALRAGCNIVPVNRYLTASEAAYIINDSKASVVVCSAELSDLAATMLPEIPNCPIRLMLDGTRDGYANYEESVTGMPSEPIEDPGAGQMMYYSSGTTGRPKGIKVANSDWGAHEDPDWADWRKLLDVTGDTVSLIASPLYHSLPLYFAMDTQAVGGTAVVMKSFDPAPALEWIEKYRCTNGSFVPTMFSRLLKLPDAERQRYDLSSLRTANHAGAPCPVHVKQGMIDWWGPVLREHYGGSENMGMTFLTSEEWLEHKGSVGKATWGILRICDEAGNEIPVGETGIVYFERENLPFEYHGNQEATQKAQNPLHPTWTTLNDIGHVDEDGYLYLSDRKDHMIVSGGVNVYPAEAEDVLISHPKVLDVGVIGIPNEEFGEEVKAIIQVAEGVEPSLTLAEELIEFCRTRLAHYKCPRSVDFQDELPRLPTGKLYKEQLKEPYWKGRESRLV